MDTGRVGACTKLENKRRKFLIVVNDVEKNKYEVYAEYLDHAHHEAEQNFEKSKMFVRRALVRQKVLQKCMKMRRRTLDTKPEFGRYGGRPIDAFSRDIEGYIAHNHPKLRRKRHLEKLLDESFDNGSILKQTAVNNKVADWMERSYTKHKLMQSKREKSTLLAIKEKGGKSAHKRQQRIPKLPVLSNPFYSMVRPEEGHNSDNYTADILKVTETLNEVHLDKEKDTAGDKNAINKDVKERRTLVLPPINPNREMISAK